jgi:DNA-binding NtrC family response regulator
LARILIVDDDKGVQHVLQSFVEKQGHNAICADTGAEGLKGRDTKPALVLLDIILPDMSGIKALERMKEIDPSVGVIMVTGLEEHDIGIESLKKGALDFVTTPVEFKHLESLIDDFHLLRAAAC